MPGDRRLDQAPQQEADEDRQRDVQRGAHQPGADPPFLEIENRRFPDERERTDSDHGHKDMAGVLKDAARPRLVGRRRHDPFQQPREQAVAEQ